MKILHEGTEYEKIEFEKMSEEWIIDVDFEGNLCIECCPRGDDQNRALVLNQDEVKQLIAFLQRRILNQNK
jgi:hypothetical protein